MKIDYIFYFDLGILVILLLLTIFKLINSEEKRLYFLFTVAILSQFLKMICIVNSFQLAFFDAFFSSVVAISLIFYNIDVLALKHKNTLRFLYTIVGFIVLFFVIEINSKTYPFNIIYNKLLIIACFTEFSMFFTFFYSSIRLKSYYLYKVSYFIMMLISLCFTFITIMIFIFKTPPNVIFNPLLSYIFKSIYIVEFLLLFMSRFYFEEKIIARSVLLEKQLLYDELAHQKSLVNERERISHDMHDDLGAGISALKLQTEFLKEKLKDDASVQKDLEELLKTSADMNISMREMLWNLNKTNDTLQCLVQYISTYAENFFSKINIKFLLQNNLSAFDLPISSDVRWHLFLCAKEAINNIYKHSSAKMVIIKFIQKDNQFYLEIEDDGIGLQNSKNPGNGFQNMTHRMQESCGKFEIVPSEKGLRLRFLLTL